MGILGIGAFWSYGANHCENCITGDGDKCSWGRELRGRMLG